MITKKIVQPFIDLLLQGISPRRLALTIALGLMLGVIPVLGSTTLLCTLAAVSLRLNLPAIQLVNGLAWPLQLTLLVPFLRAGAWLFGDRRTTITLNDVGTLIRANVWHAIVTLWTVTMHALVVWLVAACVGTAVLYMVFVPVLNQLWKKVGPITGGDAST
jgi:uncharacterized protein (DUF2062 family)